MSDRYRIAVTREHRWLDVQEQAKLLKADGYDNIVTLDGGKQTPVTRNELVNLCRPNAPTLIKVVHTFLLANLRGKDANEAREDLANVVGRIEKRGGAIWDRHLQLSTENPAHREAILARAREMIGRDRQGAKSARNLKRGAQEAEFSEAAWLKAELIWRNTKNYRSWKDCEAAYKNLDREFGHERPFTVWRANLEWGPRKATL